MTPNMGQGANTAIESAAGLSNRLRALTLAKHPEKPSAREIHDMLSEFNQARLPRLTDFHMRSWFVTRLETADGLAFRVLGRYVTQFLGDLFARGIAQIASSGVYLDYIPLTVRSGRDWPPVRMSESAAMRRLTLLLVILGFILIPLFVAWLAVAAVKIVNR